MPIIINNGYLEIYDASDNMLVYCQQIKVDFKMKPKIKHQPSNNHYGYHLETQWLEFKCRGIFLTSHADFSNFIDYLKDWQAAGTFNLRVHRTNVPNYIEWDGDNTAYIVMLKSGISGMEKIAPGPDGDTYKIGMIVFEQAG